MAEATTKERENGVPVPKEGTPEFAAMNKMAKRALPLILIIYTIGVLQQQAFNMIYVNIGEQLGQAGTAPLITSLPGIVLGIVCVVYGALGDFVSLRKMVVLGTSIFVAGSVLGLFGTANIWIVVAARVLQSAGWQVSGSLVLVLVSKYIEKRNRVIWYGIFVAIFRVGAALGVFLGGYMTLIDWRWLFGMGIIAVFFIPVLLKNLPNEHAKGARVDIVGLVLIGAFSGSVTMFFTDKNWFWGTACIVTLVAFVIYINKAANPFITPDILTKPAYALMMVVVFIGYFYAYTISAGANAIGKNVYGMDSSQVSNLLVWGFILAAIVGFTAGPLIKKLGNKISVIVGLGATGCGLLAVAFLIPHGAVLALGVAPCLYYFGQAFVYQPIVDTVAQTVYPEETGRALGFRDQVQVIASSIGGVVFGQIMANGSMSGGSLAGTDSGSASTYANMFTVGGCVVLCALVIFVCASKVIYRGLAGEKTERA
ncbi:MFS transporter [Bifidobacterium cebidarum]|uniref:MFS transporter n=1 Tax=Bifidobacterium cebidarum TaxID=2650773 RepID=A0A6I1GI53_9BIFI|nr:MFS transporter [Bifidobacterium cebidarum]KAB7789117.1 MFS transporter [Bifidobacterium cebidarum]